MVKKKDEIPSWVTDEIQNAKFEKPKKLKISGYVLEKYQEDSLRGRHNQWTQVEIGRFAIGEWSAQDSAYLNRKMYVELYIVVLPRYARNVN